MIKNNEKLYKEVEVNTSDTFLPFLRIFLKPRMVAFQACFPFKPAVWVFVSLKLSSFPVHFRAVNAFFNYF
jgi:hypothetical protein